MVFSSELHGRALQRVGFVGLPAMSTIGQGMLRIPVSFQVPLSRTRGKQQSVHFAARLHLLREYQKQE